MLMFLSTLAIAVSPAASQTWESDFATRHAFGAGESLSVVMADRDGDNDAAADVSVLLNSGDGTLVAGQTYDSGVDPESVELAD